jgi:hypothetical protein
VIIIEILLEKVKENLTLIPLLYTTLLEESVPQSNLDSLKTKMLIFLNFKCKSSSIGSSILFSATIGIIYSTDSIVYLGSFFEKASTELHSSKFENK